MRAKGSAFRATHGAAGGALLPPVFAAAAPFVKLQSQIGKLVVAVVHLLGNASFQIARSQAAHAAVENADGLGDVVGQILGQQKPHQNDKGQNNEFMPNRRQLQAGNKQRAGRTLDLRVVPAADEKQIFFAQRSNSMCASWEWGLSSAKKRAASIRRGSIGRLRISFCCRR